MDFVAIDFETATSDRDSPCEIGLTIVKDNQVVDTQSWLIKPKSYPRFESFNVYIHGIRPEDVADYTTVQECLRSFKSIYCSKYYIKVAGWPVEVGIISEAQSELRLCDQSN